MKNTKLFLAAAVGLLTVGCYNDFDTPAPAKVWTETEMQAMGLQHITIKELKDKYVDAWGLDGTGSNGGWDDTKTLKCGPAANSLEAEFATDPGNMKFWDEAANYYIKGKVISSDAQGNVYKSLYIDDGTAGIELKLCGTLYTIYKLDLSRMDSQWVYVKLKDFYLGNYRMMLSLGDAPSNSLNTGLVEKYYANSNFETPLLWRNTEVPEFNRVLPGEPCQLVEASIDDNNPEANIFKVNPTNYTKLNEAYYSRLVRFEDVEIRYAGVTYQNPVSYDAEGNVTEWSDDITKPAMADNPFPNWIVTDSGNPVFSDWYYWAYSRNNVSLYGSVLMLHNTAATKTTEAGVYSIRTSGYSRFAMKPIPQDGTKGSVLGIYGIYSKSPTYPYRQWQITVNRIEDLDFPAESLLTQQWIDHNTSEASYNPPVKNGAGEYEE